MKRYILTFILLLTSFSAYCQNTIKFLGIPIEGTKKEMIAKLEEKGYVYSSYNDYLTGEFNGENVYIYIITVNTRVWRIAVIAARNMDETNIKFHFNSLMKQFIKNGKYVYAGGSIPKQDDNLAYEIRVNKKRYDAYFHFIDPTINGLVWYTIVEDGYGKYKMCIYYENHDNAANGDDL